MTRVSLHKILGIVVMAAFVSCAPRKVVVVNKRPPAKTVVVVKPRPPRPVPVKRQVVVIH